MSVVTDPNAPAVKKAKAMIHRLPLATFGEAAVIGRLQQTGINYDADIRPLFGNPILIGMQAQCCTPTRGRGFSSRGSPGTPACSAR